MTTSDEIEHHMFNPAQDHLSECDACQRTHLELMDKHVGPGAGSPLRSESPEVIECVRALVDAGIISADPETGRPPALTPVDKMRAKGWTVAVHNDYRLNGRHHTFWLFTNGDYAAKGEGSTDDEAIQRASTEADRIVAEMASLGESTLNMADRVAELTQERDAACDRARDLDARLEAEIAEVPRAMQAEEVRIRADEASKWSSRVAELTEELKRISDPNPIDPPEGWEWEEDGLLTDHVRELTLYDADTLCVETSEVIGLTIPISAIEALTGRRLVKTVSPNQDPK